MSLRKIHRYKTNNMNIVELLKECPKYTKLYTITHGEVLFDHVEGNEYLLETAENPEK